MEPIEFLRILRRRWRVILACALIALTVALFASPSGGTTASHRQFEAKALLLAKSTKHVSSVNLSQTALLLSIGVVPTRVAQLLEYPGNPLKLVDEVKTTTDPKVGTITISTTQGSATRALALVNTFAEQMMKYLAEIAQATFQQNTTTAFSHVRLLLTQIAPINSAVKRDPTNTSLLTQQHGLQNALTVAQKAYGKAVSAGVDGAQFRIVEANSVRPEKSGFDVTSIGNRETRALLALLLGMLLGAGLALVLDKFDVRVRTKEDAEEAFGLPVVSEVPALWYPTRRRREIITAVQPISPYAEVHRILRHSLLFAHMSPFNAAEHGTNGNGHANGNGHTNGNGNGNGNGHTNGNGNGHTNGNGLTNGNGNGSGKGRQVIVVTSAGSAEGKTTTVANLAASFAESGQSVLVMSCDFHGPRIQEMLGATDAPGIANVLHGGATAPTLADVTVETSIPGVWLAPSGDGIDNPPELASSVGQLMTEARRLADVVIIDTPALLSVSAASELLPAADVAVIVARSSRTTREAAARVNERLGLLEANVLGVVLVGPQIPSVSREYSGYSRPPGGWRKRRQLLRKRDIQIGARAETLEPTRAVPAEPPARASRVAAETAPVVDLTTPAAPTASAPTAPARPAPVPVPSVPTPAPAPAPAPTVTAPAPTPTVSAPAPTPTAPAAPAPAPTGPVDFFATPAPPTSTFYDEPRRPAPPAGETPRPEGLPPRPRWRRRDTRRDD